MFRGLGSAAPSGSAVESAPRQPVRLTDRLASLQGPSEPCAGDDVLCGFLSWCPSNNVHLSMQLSFLPVASPPTGLRRSWHGTLAVPSWADSGPRAVTASLTVSARALMHELRVGLRPMQCPWGGPTRTDADGRNRRADPDHSEMRPWSWLPMRCPDYAPSRQPASSSAERRSAARPDAKRQVRAVADQV